MGRVSEGCRNQEMLPQHFYISTTFLQQRVSGGTAGAKGTNKAIRSVWSVNERDFVRQSPAIQGDWISSPQKSLLAWYHPDANWCDFNKDFTANFSYWKKQPCGSYQSCTVTCKNRRKKDVKNIKQNQKLEQNWLLSQFQSKASSLDRYTSISLNGTNKPQRFYNEYPFYTFLQSSL